MTIAESLTFNYDGLDSSYFSLINANVDGGMQEEQFMPNRSIKEDKAMRDEPYFYGFEYEPREIPVTAVFKEKWNDKLINDIKNWLNQPYYKPLIFSSDESKIYYALVTSDPALIHNSLKEGYLKLTFRCNSPYAFTPMYTVDYLLDNNANGTTIELDNVGNKRIRPKITFKKIGNGDISIINTSDGGRETKITNLKDNEEIIIDGLNEDIETSILGGYRFDDFNYKFLELVVGKNYLKIIGNGYFQFHYQGKRL